MLKNPANLTVVLDIFIYGRVSFITAVIYNQKQYFTNLKQTTQQ